MWLDWVAPSPNKTGGVKAKIGAWKQARNALDAQWWPSWWPLHLFGADPSTLTTISERLTKPLSIESQTISEPPVTQTHASPGNITKSSPKAKQEPKC